MQITTRLEFDAGHRIPSHKSQCRNLHGHRYVIEITLSGDIIQNEGASEQGMVMDFSDVKAIARQAVVDPWDHAFLVYKADCAVLDFLNTLRPAADLFTDATGAPVTGITAGSIQSIDVPEPTATIAAVASLGILLRRRSPRAESRILQ